MHVLPGDVIDALAGEAEAHDPAVRAALTKELGLDKPIYVQYAIWLGKIVCMAISASQSPPGGRSGWRSSNACRPPCTWRWRRW